MNLLRVLIGDDLRDGGVFQRDFAVLFELLQQPFCVTRFKTIGGRGLFLEFLARCWWSELQHGGIDGS